MRGGIRCLFTIGCLVALTTVAGCAAPVPAAVSGVTLRATLVDPVDIQLDWLGGEQGIAGRVVEFATEPRGQYTILRFTPPGQTSFRHPDLMPETPFYYRIRDFSGPVSAEIEVILPPGPFSEQDQAGDHEWAPPRKIPDPAAVKQSIHAAPGAGAPTGFTATVMHANGIKFTWTDHANDEEGYLLESRPAGKIDFGVVAVLDPDVTSVGVITLPGEKTATYRVRAFSYGPQSNVVHETTGKTPAG